MKFLASRNIHLKNPPATASDAGSLSSEGHAGTNSVALVDIDPSSVLPGVFKFPNPDKDDPETRFQRIADQQEIKVDEQTTLRTASLGSEQLHQVARETISHRGEQSPYKIYPGHGPVIEDGPAKIREYIKHRLDREKQIVGVLAGDGSSNDTLGNIEGKTAFEIVKVIYAAYPESLFAPAEHQVLLHLKKLEQDGKIKRVKPAEEISDVIWGLAPQASH
ncbi:hypothetical protein BGX27_001583 [Mortierella sp. AM989]|nr:hypothetical protein BGX27_001583 [Mortierella sp. AM989]